MLENVCPTTVGSHIQAKGNTMSILKLGVIGTSKKADERRVPIHPEHLPRLPENLRRQLIFETGYGDPFGITDLELAQQTGGIASRD